MKKKGGRIFLGFMVKEEKEENRGSVEFQVFNFTNKIRRLSSHLELHKKDFSSEKVYEYFWENVDVCWLIWQRKIEYVIRN
jgi:ribosomal protein S15P/S13E